MTMRIRQCMFAVAAVTMLFGSVTTAQAADERRYLLGTASTGGTYYPVGVAIATLTKVKLQPTQKISMSAINSAGSGAHGQRPNQQWPNPQGTDRERVNADNRSADQPPSSGKPG